MIDNDTAVKMQKDTLEEFVKSANNVFESVVGNFDKEIIKIKKFEFDENQVTVTFDAKIETDTKYLGNNLEETSELSKKDTFDAKAETITLKKVDGNWKVIYADLLYNNYMSSGMVTQVSM